MALADTARLIASLELQDKFTRTAANAEQAMDRLDRKSGLLGGSFGRIGDNLGQMGRGIGQVGTGFDKIITSGAIAATAGLGAIITTAASFEQSEAGIRKTVAGTTQEVDALIDSIKQMSRTVPLSFEELAAIAAEGGALGIATGSLANFTDIVARLGVSTDLTTEQAASALGQMSNVLHLTDDDLRDFGDSLVALGNDGASTESQILDLATRFGAAGKQAGLSNESILALASTTASMGVEAEAGGGALSRIFSGITLDIGTATDESKVLADSMGLSLAELRAAWDQDAGKVFGDLLGYINKLDKFQAAEFLSNLGITNVRDINAITLLASGVDEYSRQLGVAQGQTNELNKESDVFFNTTEGKWEIFKNNVRLAADSIGGELLPVVNEVLGDLVAGLSDPKTQQSLREFGENLAGGIRNFIGEIKKADLGPLLDVLKTTAGIARGAFDAFRQLPPGVQALALAAFGINKVTGGALGDIAKGFGNIFAGGLKILFERGSSAANPLWVQSVGGIGGKGPGDLIPTVGKAGAAALAASVAAALVVVAATTQGGSDNPDAEMENKRIQLARELNEGVIDAAEAARLWAEAYGKTVKNPFIAVPPPRSGSASTDPSRPRDLPVRVDISDSPLFAQMAGTFGKLATTEVIEHLIRTNEIGLKDVGTSFQVGLANGLDPIGDVATSILARAEDPKAPEVMHEIQGHIAGLEEIQAQYLATGDVKLAGKVQTNIDTLHALIGSVDESRAVDIANAAADAARIQGLRDSHVSAIVAQTANNAARLGELRDSHVAAIATVSSRLDLERAQSAGYQAADAARIQGLRDSHVAAAAAAAGYQAADAARIQGLRDSHNAALAKFDTTNVKLAELNAKSWTPIINLTNSVSISATLLEQRLITARVAANGTPTTPNIL